MVCQDVCTRKIDQILRNITGVNNVFVNFKTQSVIVEGEFDAGMVIKALQKSEFTATRIEETKPDIEISIEGMMCQKNCGTTVQNALSRVPDVLWATVSFAESKGRIWGSATFENLVEAVEAVGFEAKQIMVDDDEEIGDAEESPDCILSIQGMTDPVVCPRRVREVLLAVDGVLDVDVRFQMKECLVWGFADPNTMVEALNAAGFHCSLDENDRLSKSLATGMSSLPNLDRDRAHHSDRLRANNPKARGDLELSISGMSCANCAAKIEKSLRQIPGVRDAAVSSVTNKALVIVQDHSDRPDVEVIVSTVRALGFGCEPIEEISTDNSTRQNANAQNIDGHRDVRAWGWVLAFALLFGLPVMALHIGASSSTRLHLTLMRPVLCSGGISAGQVIMLLLNVPLQFGVGFRYYRAAFLGAIHNSFGMDFLVVLGTTITFVYNLSQLGIGCATHSISKHIFLESSGMLLMFVTIGKYLEAYAKGKTVSAITSLMQLQPRQVCVDVLVFYICFVKLF